MGKLGTQVNEQDLDQLIALFQLLADKTRLRILLLLADGERNVTSLCRSLSVPQPTVSHHLGLLRGRHLIGNRRQGKQVFYNLNHEILSAGHELEVGIDRLCVRICSRTGAGTGKSGDGEGHPASQSRSTL